MELLSIGISIITMVMVAGLMWLVYKNGSEEKKGETDGDMQELAEKISLKTSLVINENLNFKQSQYQKQIQEGQFETQTRLQKVLQEGQVEVLTKLQGGLEEVRTKQTESLNSNQRQMLELKLENKDQLTAILEQIKISLAGITADINKQNAHNFDTLNKTNQERLTGIQNEMEKRFETNMEQNLKSFVEVSKNLTQMQTSAQQMLEATKSVDKLNNIFARTSVKAFGSFAEDYLEAILSDNLHPSSWARQVKLTGGSESIDFVVEFGDKKLGIDSKFPRTAYEDYISATMDEKEAKRKIFEDAVLLNLSSIQAKYAKGGSLDFLIMYVPSDGMYVEISNSSKLLDRIAKSKVYLSSPAIILPLISMIQSYQKRTMVNEKAEVIMEGLKKVNLNLVAFQDEYRKLGDKLREAQNNYTKADSNLLKVHNQIVALESHDEINDKSPQVVIQVAEGLGM